MLIVGLTGGIGSGKSAAAARFRERGINVVDADWAARVVVEPGRAALGEIAEHFGTDILLASGELNRAALREKVFNTPSERKWLEQLLHPLIRQEILRALATSTGPYAILESPLLIESGQSELVHRICVVDVPEATQRARASARDGADPQQIRKIMDAQLPRAQRLAQADHILDNSGTLAELQAQVDQLHTALVAHSEQLTKQATDRS